MQKWEYRRLYMCVSSDGNYYIQQKDKVVKGSAIIDLINTYGDAGWDLVSVTPKIGNETLFELDNNKVDKKKLSGGEIINNVFTGMIIGPVVTNSTQYKTATVGYWLWFKRPKE